MFQEGMEFPLKFLQGSNNHLSIHNLQVDQFKLHHKSSLQRKVDKIIQFLQEK